MIVYGSDGGSGYKTIFGSADMGQGSVLLHGSPVM